jgi:hypothetical protein
MSCRERVAICFETMLMFRHGASPHKIGAKFGKVSSALY